MKNKEQVNKEFNEKFRTGEASWHPNYIHIESHISSIRQNDVDELIEALKVKELKPPYEDKDFEKEDGDTLTDISIRNAIKHLRNQQGWESRNAYNSALLDIIAHLKSIKEKI